MADMSMSLDARFVADQPDEILRRVWRLTTNVIRSLHLDDSPESAGVRANLERQAASVGRELMRRNLI